MSFVCRRVRTLEHSDGGSRCVSAGASDAGTRDIPGARGFALPASLTLKERSFTVGLATLKRWSVQFGWASAVARHSNEVTTAMARASKERLAATMRNDLEAIRAAKQRCVHHLLLDPEDPSLSAAQRRRLRNPTVRDYCRLIKMEHQLLKCCGNRPSGTGTTALPAAQPNSVWLPVGGLLQTQVPGPGMAQVTYIGFCQP
jgi:hypothetical protein